MYIYIAIGQSSVHGFLYTIWYFVLTHTHAHNFYDFTVRDVEPQSLICDRFNGFVATMRLSKVSVTVRFRIYIIL